jgi:hypothetical protein
MLSREELDILDMAYALGISIKDTLEMPWDDFLLWSEYFSRKPIGYREDYRTSLLISATGAKINEDKVFPSLYAFKNGMRERPSNFVNSLRSSALFSKMLSATGGDDPKLILGE